MLTMECSFRHTAWLGVGGRQPSARDAGVSCHVMLQALWLRIQGLLSSANSRLVLRTVALRLFSLA
jgi:hypothetical protein